MPLLEPVTLLRGHVSPETAYVAHDQPLKTGRGPVRFWIHTAPHGTQAGKRRLMFQTADPTRPGLVWGAPHRQRYHLLQVLYRDPAGQVGSWGLTEFPVRPDAEAFVRLTSRHDQFDPADRVFYDQRVAVSRGYPGPWREWETTLAEHLRATYPYCPLAVPYLDNLGCVQVWDLSAFGLTAEEDAWCWIIGVYDHLLPEQRALYDTTLQHSCDDD